MQAIIDVIVGKYFIRHTGANNALAQALTTQDSSVVEALIS
jgi:hypothetical protein